MSLTNAQQEAVAARGNVLVMAGAGTGKTSTLVERAVTCLCDPGSGASLDELLIVTFTEAAATEVRRRIREELERRASDTGDPRWSEQLALFDTAHIGTLHSFCFKLIRQHFHGLGLDPQLTVLDEGQARLTADETLETLLQTHYSARDEASEAVRQLIHTQGGGRDKAIRTLILRLHHYTQTRAEPGAWFESQFNLFVSPTPERWREWLMDGIADWRSRWRPALESMAPENEKAAECLTILADETPRALPSVVAADKVWPKGKKTRLEPPLKHFFEEAAFLASLADSTDGGDPLVEDWEWTRGAMTTLLRLAQGFSARFSEDKREAAVVDFHDLEQFALRLLWDFETGAPTEAAMHWRRKIRFVFVDEYQDINAAQDRIITALSRDGTEANRFLVGDVKQGIYRFRLADPEIFRNYAEDWRGGSGKTVSLVENFRSREHVLQFVNSVFGLLMRREVGGVTYDGDAKLRFGAPEQRKALSAAGDTAPRAELLLRIKGGNPPAIGTDGDPADELAELEDAEKEARLIALRLRELQRTGHEIWDSDGECFRALEWRDVAVLLRAPSGKAERYAKEFAKFGVPLVVERGGFFQNTEVTDLLSLLQVLDNPLQDLPLLAVLRSPLVGLSINELATIRMALKRGHFWTALNRSQKSALRDQKSTAAGKVGLFLDRFARWRRLARLASLSRCLETVLAETHYADWLRSQPRGAQCCANVQRLLGLAEQFDQFQRQGLFRFLRFIEAQREAGVEPEIAPAAGENAVRLMSIHQSKGLEFPVVVVADFGKRFNEQDLNAEIILDERHGVCPHIQPPHTGARYPSLPWWLAQRRQRCELRGEELRLLYVAMTRARDTLILTGGVSRKKWESHWRQNGDVTPQAILAAQSYADWIGLWFGQNRSAPAGDANGEMPFLRWSVCADGELTTPGESETDGSKAEVELSVPDSEIERKLREVLMWKYRFGAATERAGKTSVTALRRQAEEPDDEVEPMFVPRRQRPTPRRSTGKLSAAEAGTAHHKFLQHVALAQTGDAKALEAEAKRLTGRGALSPDEAAALDLKSLTAFWQSEVGRKICAQPENVRRELPFTARFAPDELATVMGTRHEPGLADEFVVVQGVADLVVILPKEIWLVDFKTDQMTGRELPEKKKFYEPQLRLYSLALNRIYHRPVTELWLHFFGVSRSVRL